MVYYTQFTCTVGVPVHHSENEECYHISGFDNDVMVFAHGINKITC